MQDMLKKMKKKEGNMPEHEKNAKMSVLSHLRDMAQQAMGDKLHGMKKVSVMSDSPEGMKRGLDVAKNIATHSENNVDELTPDHMELDPHEESEDSYENLADDEGGIDKSPHDMDHNELGQHIAKLQALHHSMKEE